MNSEYNFECELLETEDEFVYTNLELKNGTYEHETRSLWSDDATKSLLHLVTKNIENVGKTTALKTKSKMWKFIAERMANDGHAFSPTQVESKFRGMERSYKKMILNNKSTGRGRMTIPFQNELDAILSKKKGVNPSYLLGVERVEPEDITTVLTAPNSPCVSDETPTKKARCSGQEKTLQVLNDMLAEQKQEHREILAALKECEDNKNRREAEKEVNRERRAQRKEELLSQILETLRR